MMKITVCGIKFTVASISDKGSECRVELDSCQKASWVQVYRAFRGESNTESKTPVYYKINGSERK